MNKFLSYILALTMCFGVISTVFATEFTFIDVPESEWYYADVKNAVELGLINGKT